MTRVFFGSGPPDGGAGGSAPTPGIEKRAMQPICSVRIDSTPRVWFLGVSHAIGMASALLAAVACVWAGVTGSTTWRTTASRSPCLGGSSGRPGRRRPLRLRPVEGAGPNRGGGERRRARRNAPGDGAPVGHFLWETARGILLVFAVLALAAVLVVGVIHRLVQRARAHDAPMPRDRHERRSPEGDRPDSPASARGCSGVGLVHCGKQQGIVGTRVESYPCSGPTPRSRGWSGATASTRSSSPRPARSSPGCCDVCDRFVTAVSRSRTTVPSTKS